MTLILQLILAALLAAQSQASQSPGAGADGRVPSSRPVPSRGSAFRDLEPSGLSRSRHSQLVPPAQAIKGNATWYDAPSIHDAAAGPALRAAIGKHWRGTTVTVSRGGRQVIAKLTDFCACGRRNGQDTLIDLDDQAFRELAPLSRGVVPVTVSWGGTIELPATDTAP